MFHKAFGGRKVMALLALAVMIGLLGGCASFGPTGEAVPPETLPPYTLDILQMGEPSVSDDGYEVILRFEICADAPFPYRSLIQEIEQTATYEFADGKQSRENLTLVEAFRLDSWPNRTDAGKWIYALEPFQRDRHFEAGFAATQAEVAQIEVRRDVTIYPAVIENADFTFLGFAHLPGNREGSVKTIIPDNFNRRYQGSHQTQGKVVVDDRAQGSRHYHFVYTWKRKPDGHVHAKMIFSPDGKLDRNLDSAAGGAGEQPEK